ncbi:MAG: phosphate signaling complex protein PhoU [Planctomycetes bacterium]|nr:phosphate signaling complex protein PhoU [Planctomycetota bacterium]
MPIHLHTEIEKLNRAAVAMCAQVEQNVRDATRAFLERDTVLAGKVIAADRLVDKMETELTEDCLKIMALYQPVAGDLRFIFSLSKISAILERVGDLAENLARKGRALANKQPIAVPRDVAEMADQARAMLTCSIDSLVGADAGKARSVISADYVVNGGKRTVRKLGEAAIMANPSLCPQWLIIISASRHIERMADMAANIAAQVIYSVEGKSVRHGFDCDDGSGDQDGMIEIRINDDAEG